MMLETRLGTARLLARPGERRLWVLDAGAAALWDLHTAGWAGESLVGLLAEHFELAPAVTRHYLDGSYAEWQAAGLLTGADTVDRPCDPIEIVPNLPEPAPGAAPLGAWWRSVADRTVSLWIQDEGLRAALAPLLPTSPDPDDTQPAQAPCDHLALYGDKTHWTLRGNGAELASDQGRDAAVVAALSAITELGCRTRERLLVVHGAGLLAPGGRALLLIAPGGCGKSTLAAGLNAAGCGLLSDDVVPVTPAGDLLGLGLPLCLKPGSWPVLRARRPDLDQAPAVQRFGQTVRYLPAHGRPVTGAHPPALFLFPRYHPGQPPHCEPRLPEQALQGLVEAEAVIRDLDQAKLEALARWVSAVPAYALTYPDLDSGLALVRDLLEALPASSGGPCGVACPFIDDAVTP